MHNDYKRRHGTIVEHNDGRRGIAYDNDQLEQFLKQEKFIVRFFIENEIKNGLSDKKHAVKFNKLKTIGMVD